MIGKEWSCRSEPVAVQVDRADHASKILVIISLYSGSDWSRPRVLHYPGNISKLSNKNNSEQSSYSLNLTDCHSLKQFIDEVWSVNLKFLKFSRYQLMYDEGIMICWIIEEILIIILRSQNTISNITVNQVIKEAVFSFDNFCSRFARMFSSASPGAIQSRCLTVDCVE